MMKHKSKVHTSKLTSKTWSTFFGFGERAGDNPPTHVKPATTRQHPIDASTHDRAMNTTGKDINALSTRIDTDHTQKHLTLRPTRKTKQFVAFGLLLLASALTTPVAAQTTVDICSRTTEVQTAILAAIPGSPACTAVTLSTVTGSLSLSGMSISTLLAGDFDGLTGLTELYLQDNDLSALPANLFDELTSLNTLWLQGNPITTPLPADIFDSLPFTTVIRIDVSPIGDLPDIPTLSVGGTATINVADAFVSKGNIGIDRPLSLTTALTGTSVASATESGGVVTITASNTITGMTDVEITASDGTGGATGMATRTIAVLVEGVVDICSRTAEVQTAILAAISPTPACADVTSTQLADITGSLALSLMSISALLPGDFAGLSGITSLFLSGNILLSTLPSGIFDDLASLTTLSLRGNSLTTLPANLFDPLTNLTTLDLALNSLTTLPAGVFDGLTSLTDLQLQNNTFTTPLPANIFDPVSSATIQIDLSPIGDLADIPLLLVGNTTPLDVSGAFISKDADGNDRTLTYTATPADTSVATVSSLAGGVGIITAGSAVGTTNINIVADDSVGMSTRTFTVTVALINICDRTAEVETAILNEISPSPACDAVTPAQLAAITGTLDLSFLDITSLQSGDFAGLSGLTELNLSENLLSALPAGLFNDLTSLSILDLGFNELSTLPAGIFDPLTSLTELWLYINFLTALPDGIFDELTGLTILDLNDSGLTTLQADVFDNLTNLSILDLSFNFLSALPADLFSGLTSLSTLRLQNNTFTTPLPANIFADLPSTGVIEIDLSPIGDLTGVTLTASGTVTITVANAFISRDSTGADRTLSYTLTPADTTIATATESGGVVSIITGANVGATTVSVEADDSVSNTVTRNITVTVEAAGGILAFDEAMGGTIATPVVAENSGTDTFYVRLSSRPANDVTLSVMSSNINEGMVSPSELTFTNTNSNVLQLVTVTAVPDDIDSDDTFTVDFAVTTGDTGNYPTDLSIPSVTVTITDDDTAGIALFEEIDSATGSTQVTSITTGEPNTPATFYVELTSAPTADVTVAVTSTDTTEGTITTGASLTFTVAGGATPWNVRQAVTVTGVDDPDADGNINYSVTLDPESADTEYSGLADSTVDATNTDDDTAGLAFFDAATAGNPVTAITTGEPDVATTFYVQLTSNPTADVTVTVMSGDTTEGTITTGGSLTFTAAGGATPWNVRQAVTVTGQDDSDVDGNINYSVTLNPASTDTGYNGLADSTVAATNTDDDTSPGLALFDAATGNAAPALTTDEDGTFDTFYVQLTTAPTADVTVAVTSGDTTEGTITTGASLTFTTGNWDTRQLVIVTGVDDDLIDDDTDYTVTLASTSTDTNYSALTDSMVTVTNTDDDTAGIALFEEADSAMGSTAVTTITTGEDGTFDTFYVELISEPTADVTVAVTSDDTSEGTITTGASLTFTTGNWNIRQAVTVTGVDDDLIDGDQTYTVTLNPASATDTNYDGLDDTTVTATNTDEVAGLALFAEVNSATGSTVVTAITTREPNVATTFYVELTSQPTANVTVAVMSSDTTEGTILTATGATLTFTTGNWNMRQGVLVIGANDNLADGDQTYTITLNPASSDTDYNALPDTTVAATNTDDDALLSGLALFDAATAGTMVTSITTGEPDVAATFYVELTTAPTADVTVTVTSDTTTEGTITTGASLTFTSTDWNMRQAVTVTGANDDLTDGDQTYIVTLNPTSTDTEYSGLADTTVDATNTDDDAVVNICSRTTLVQMAILAAIPGSTCSTVIESQLAAITGSLTLSLMSISALLPGDFDGLSGITSLFLSGNSLSTLPSGIFDDLASLTTLELGGNALTTIEANAFSGLTSLTTLNLGGNSLSALPAGLFSGLGSLTALRLDGNAFTTPLPANLFDPLPDAAVIQIDLSPIGDLPSIPSLTLGGVTTINVTDKFISRDSSGVDRTLSYIVAVSGGTSVASVAEDAGVVTITASSTITGTSTVGITVSDTVSPFLTRDIAVTVDAPPPAALALFEESTSGAGSTAVTAITTTEAGGTATFYVELTTAPTADVTVAVTSDDTTEGMITTGASLTFTTGNWNMRQAVTVTGANDDFADGDQTYTVTLNPASTDPAYNALTDTTVAATNTDDDVAVDICSRTTQVRDAILAAISPTATCSTVTALQLAAITGTLDLSFMGIRLFQSGDFDGLSGLTELEIRANDLTLLPANLLDPLTSLTLLDVGNGVLATIEANAFSGLTSLTSLDLSDNFLSALPDDLFLGLGSLATLRLQGNTFTTPLPANLFDPLPDAAVIEIDLSPIGDLADIPSLTLGGVATINVANAFISRTSAGTDRALSFTITPTGTSVASATESSGVLTITASDTITGVTNVDITASDGESGTVGMSARTIAVTVTEVVNICARTTQVRDAILAAISPSPLCTAVTAAQLAAITSTLNLSRMSIGSLQAGDFAGLSGLTSLNLTINSLSTLPAGVFDELTSLTSLNLSFNSLSALPAGIFDNLTGLTSLELNSNTLSALPMGVFDNLTSLTQLFLSNNMLTALPAGLFTGLTSLNFLRLQGNTFTTALPANIFAPVSSATIQIDLSPIGDLTDVALTVGGVPTINVANAFISRDSSGNDRTPITYTLTSANTAVATAMESSGVVTITGVAMGTTTVSVLANDGESGTVGMLTRNIAVTVVGTGILAFDAAMGDTIATPIVAEASGTDTFYVQLASAPASDVTLTLTSSDTSEGTVMPGTLTFTAAAGTTSWDTRQAVTVTAVDDNVDRDDTFTVSFAIATVADGDGGDYTNSLTIPGVTVTVTDDDSAGLALFEESTSGAGSTAVTAITTTEAGGTATFYVELTSAPTADVTVTVMSDDTTEGMITTGASLVFSSTTWNIRQEVTVTGQDDSDVDGDQTYAVTLSPASSDLLYNALADSTVTATNTDNDVAAAALALFEESTSGAGSTAVTAITTTEAGGTATFYVELTSAPTADVTVTVMSDDTTEGMITTGASLVFSSTTWNIRQEVTVTGQDDSDVDGDVDYTVTLSPASSDLLYNALADSTVTATNTDNDVAAAALALFEESTSGAGSTAVTAITTTEAGGTATFYVELTTAPTADVTVAVTSDDTDEGTITTGDSLVFSSTTWNIRQEVTVTGQDDSDVDGDQTYAVTLSPASSDLLYNALADSTVTATNTDNDVAAAALALFEESTSGAGSTAVTAITTTEAGGTATFYVELTTAPTADVTVAVTSDDTDEGTITTGDSLTFTTGNWNIRQEVTVTGQDDSDVDGDQTYTVTLNPASSDLLYNALADSTVTATNTDDDVAPAAALALFEESTSGAGSTAVTAITTTEAGGTATFYVELTTAPTADVTVAVMSDDTDEGTITTGDSLTFTTGNWNVRQLVTVTGVDDSDVDGDQTYTVTLNPASSDTAYNALADSTVTATNTDDDVAAALALFEESTSGAGSTQVTELTTTEAGGTATFYVELTTAPTADVTVAVMSSDTDEGTITTGTSLTFTTGNWNMRQEVTVTGVDDSDVDGDQTYTVTLNPASSDTAYNALADSTVTATNTDDEFSEQDQQAIEQTVAAQASGITQVVTEQIGIRLASRTLAGSTQERQSLSAIDWQDDLAKFTYEGLKHLDSEADMSLDWLLQAAGGNGQVVMPLGAEALTLWATGGRISTKGDGVADYDGDVNSFILGIDTALSNDWLAGIAVSYNDSEVDYTMDGTPEAETEQTLYGIHPYLSRTVSKGLTLWGTVGYGFGDVDFSHTDRGQATSDITQWMAAGGLEQQIITNTPWQGALRIKGLWGNAEVDAARYSGGIPIAKVDTDFWRARMESEMGYNFSLPGGNVRPYAIIGGRWDHNDAIVSGDEWHVDVGGGVELSDNAFALNISVRTQVTDGDTEEDSIFATGSVTYDLEQDGQGLQIALSRPLNNTSPAFDSHSFNEVTTSGLSGAPLTSELAYGWTVRPFGLKGALQTYVQNSFDNDDRHYAVGLELAVNALTLNFETGYHDHTSLNSGKTDNTGLESMFKTKIRW